MQELVSSKDLGFDFFSEIYSIYTKYRTSYAGRCVGLCAETYNAEREASGGKESKISPY